MGWEAVAALDALDEGRPHRASAGGVDLVLARQGEEVHAWLDACPHEGHPLSEGEIHAGVIVCPRHLWEFDLRTGGHVTRVPRSQHNLTRVPCRVNGGQVEVDPDAAFG